MTAPVRTRVPPSKTLATWIAVLGGSLGLHHFYLRGLRQWRGWLYPIPSLIGLVGVLRMRNLGQDDTISWLLIPCLGLSISIAMLCAILIGLTPDATWARRYSEAPAQMHPQDIEEDADEPPPPGFVRTAWGPVLGVIVALMLGSTVLTGTITFSIQKFFEWNVDPR